MRRFCDLCSPSWVFTNMEGFATLVSGLFCAESAAGLVNMPQLLTGIR